MLIIRYLCVVLAFHVFFLGRAATAQTTTDARVLLQSLLAQFGPVPITTIIHNDNCTTICPPPIPRGPGGGGAHGPGDRGDIRIPEKPLPLALPWRTSVQVSYPQQPRPGAPHNLGLYASCFQSCAPFDSSSTANRVLTFGNVSVILAGDIVFGAPIFHDIPDQLYAASMIGQNCSGDTQTSSQMLTISTQVGSSATVTHGISNTIGDTLILKFAPASWMDVSNQINFSQTVSVQNTQTETKQDTYSASDTVNLSVPSKTTIIAQLQAYKQSGKVPFSVNAVLDAPVESNDRGFHMISDMISQQKRTVPVTGVVEIAGMTAAHVVYFNTTFDPTKCPATGGSASLIILRPTADSFKGLDVTKGASRLEDILGTRR